MELGTAMLADGARRGADGKLYIFGGQWDQIFVASLPTTQRLAFALVVQVDYGEALKDHRIEIALKDPDGQDLDTRVAIGFKPGHPPLTVEGAPISVPIAIEPPPIAIKQHGRLIWEVTLDDKLVGSLPMTVRPLPNQALRMMQQPGGENLDPNG